MKKKRILCSLLTLAMLMALLTVTAFAEEAALTLPTGGGDLASGTYQLMEDLTISHSLNIPSGSDITIDLNGHTLNTTAANWGVLVRGTCTIVDSAENGTIESGEHAFLIYPGGKLRINGGTTNASGTASTAIVNAAGAELTISNAKVSSSVGPALQNQGGAVTIQGAELYSGVAAGIFNLDGSVTVSDSTIYGNDNGILNGLEGVDGNPSIIISNSTVSSNASYAVNNALPGSSLTATKTNFIAKKPYVIRNAGKLSIDAASSLTNSNSPIPGKIIEDASIDVLLPAGESWQDVVTEQPTKGYEEDKTEKSSQFPHRRRWHGGRQRLRRADLLLTTPLRSQVHWICAPISGSLSMLGANLRRSPVRWLGSPFRVRTASSGICRFVEIVLYLMVIPMPADSLARQKIRLQSGTLHLIALTSPSMANTTEIRWVL